jgi:N-acetylglucosaminyldiphosphoundecaprenol N-acetyl-beta-D-mannosaminyltransferase
MAAPVDVLGVRVDPITWPELRELVARNIQARVRTTVMYANAHVVNTAQRVPELADALRCADVVYCDGEGVRVAARLLGASLPARLTGADFIDDLARRAAELCLRVFWLGGRAGAAESALAALAARHPGLRVAGARHGYFAKHGPETDAVIECIEASHADLVLVGMGTPTQELWVARQRARIAAPVVWCVGATADFVVGAQPRGPAVLTQHGFEWLARFASDPRRLFGRYVVGNPLFLARVLASRLGRRRPPAARQ